jgi:hypothetical protein
MQSMKKHSLLLLFGVVLMSACGGGHKQTDPAILQLTAINVASTMMAETSAAMPATTTFTALPTDTSTPTAAPTFPPTSTPYAAETSLPTSPPADTATPFKAPNKLAPLKLTNNTKQEIRFILSNPGYQEYKFTKTIFIQVQYGSYDYTVYIGTDGPYTGTIFVNNPDKWEFVFDKNGVTFYPP